jgi:hypothetical protein
MRSSSWRRVDPHAVKSLRPGLRRDVVKQRFATLAHYVTPDAVSLYARQDCEEPRSSPAAFNKHVPVMPVIPSRCHPVCTWTRRCFPPAPLPGISVSVPAVVSTYPDMLPAGGYAAMLDDHSRRCKLYDNFGGLNGRDSHAQSEQRR